MGRLCSCCHLAFQESRTFAWPFSQLCSSPSKLICSKLHNTTVKLKQHHPKAFLSHPLNKINFSKPYPWSTEDKMMKTQSVTHLQSSRGEAQSHHRCDLGFWDAVRNPRMTQDKVLYKPARTSPINSHCDTEEPEERLLWGYKDTSIGEIMNLSLLFNLVAMCMTFVLQKSCVRSSVPRVTGLRSD